MLIEICFSIGNKYMECELTEDGIAAGVGNHGLGHVRQAEGHPVL